MMAMKTQAKVVSGCSREGGFTLLEILMAMIILAVGGVGVLSLFAAAVGLQYESVIDQRKALILSDVVAEMQQVVNAHVPSEEQKLPPDIEKTPAAQFPRDFEYSVKFKEVGVFPAGEGVVAEITIYFRGRALDPVNRILQRTVFSKQEIEKSISYERDRLAEQQKASKDSGSSLPESD